MDPRDTEYSDDGDLHYIDSDDLEGMQIISDQDDDSYDDYGQDDINDLYDSMSDVRDQGYFLDREY
jgi:DNA-binding IclR family transcriptional regulator